MSDLNFQKFLLTSSNKSVKENLKNYNEQNEKWDRIIVWLVGFSITAITLIIGAISESNPFVESISAYVVFFGAATVLFGLLYRISLSLFAQYQLDVLMTFDSHVLGYNLPDDIVYSRDVDPNNTTLEEVIRYLMEDFGHIADESDFVGLNWETDKEQIRTRLVEKYDEIKLSRLAMETEVFKETLRGILGDKGVEINKKVNKPKRMWFFYSASNVLFYLTCFSFLIGLFVVVGHYFKNDAQTVQSVAPANEGTKELQIQIDSLRNEIQKCELMLDVYEGLPMGV
ncbi:hypothetical protein [Maribacter flavus]|uniref:Uncharacterized protein n=1 Tax=Maribacter flavus TaxID=1658664 RepID=A0A5B2TY13_9FLAO|nr:hypothetical protein [Maribacter flavus]KAA2218540.1 hypothetical protein F0361_02650 [Maribacter flavus]